MSARKWGRRWSWEHVPNDLWNNGSSCCVIGASRLGDLGHRVRYLLYNELMNPRANMEQLTGVPNPVGVGARAKQSMAALVGMLLVAAAGVILNWPWWLDYALITPLAIWLIINSQLVVYRQLNS